MQIFKSKKRVMIEHLTKELEYVKKEKKDLETEVTGLKRLAEHNYNVANDFEKQNEELNIKLEEYKLTKDLLEKELIKKNKQLEKTKGKLYSERRDFKITIKELEKELSKRYIVKTLKPTKPTKQVMNIKNGAKQSKIIKKIKED